MNLRRALMVVLPVLAGFAVVALWPKPRRSPEDEVRAWVAKLVDAAERRDVAELSDSLSDSFKGGGLSRQETKQMLAGMLLRSGQGVIVLNPSLEVIMESPTSGIFRGTFVFAQGKGGSGGDLGRYEIKARFSKPTDQWQLDGAQWK